jgi:hypothetical protein
VLLKDAKLIEQELKSAKLNTSFVEGARKLAGILL